MQRSDLNPMPEYFDRYILKCDDVPLLTALQISEDELVDIPVKKWKAIEDTVYAPGKWTIKEILQHVIDTERIFTYRALAFARGEEQAMPSFSEDKYAKASATYRRDLEALIAELKAVRQSTLALYDSFSTDMLMHKGQGFKGPYSVAAIGFILAGHQRWHFGIIEERYLPLIKP